MKMGVKEFRERFSEIAEGEETISVTKNGVRIGYYSPERHRVRMPDELRAWVKRMEEDRDQWRAMTPDWRERSLAAGIPADELDDEPEC